MEKEIQNQIKTDPIFGDYFVIKNNLNKNKDKNKNQENSNEKEDKIKK